MTLEKRLNAYRPDLADERLRGLIEADRFVTGEPQQVSANIATLYRTPDVNGRQETQCLFGETCTVFDEGNGFSFVQLEADQYVGYMASAALTPQINQQTHSVVVPATLRYPQADIKTQPVLPLLLNSKLSVVATIDSFHQLATGGFVFADHTAKVPTPPQDYVAIAEKFLHVPYLWGGKSVHGLDCSGLVQLALNATGIAAPRDADMQEKDLGQNLMVNDLDHLQRGDLVFWPGHVGIMQNDTMLLHANGYHMLTVVEPLQQAISRIAKTAGLPTAIKRL